MAMKRQHCDNCGEFLGEFAHSRRLDGPLSCGAPECEREARDEEKAQRFVAQQDAEEDGYSRYGGGW